MDQRAKSYCKKVVFLVSGRQVKTGSGRFCYSTREKAEAISVISKATGYLHGKVSFLGTLALLNF